MVPRPLQCSADLQGPTERDIEAAAPPGIVSKEPVISESCTARMFVELLKLLPLQLKTRKYEIDQSE